MNTCGNDTPESNGGDNVHGDGTATIEGPVRKSTIPIADCESHELTDRKMDGQFVEEYA